jgi:hypothetical protein
MKTTDPNNIHPQDMRNLFIFFLAAVIVYFLYTHMIIKPQQQATARGAEGISAGRGAKTRSADQNAAAGRSAG